MTGIIRVSCKPQVPPFPLHPGLLTGSMAFDGTPDGGFNILASIPAPSLIQGSLGGRVPSGGAPRPSVGWGTQYHQQPLPLLGGDGLGPPSGVQPLVEAGGARGGVKRARSQCSGDPSLGDEALGGHHRTGVRDCIRCPCIYGPFVHSVTHWEDLFSSSISCSLPSQYARC